MISPEEDQKTLKVEEIVVKDNDISPFEYTLFWNSKRFLVRTPIILRERSVSRSRALLLRSRMESRSVKYELLTRFPLSHEPSDVRIL